MKIPLLASLSVFALTASLQAAPDAEIPTELAREAGVFTIYFENDYFGGSDRHYTNGAKLSWLSADLSDWGQEGWRKGFIDFLPFVNRPEGQKNFGLAVGQNIYTPQDTELAIPDPADRPYAGWSYVELTFISKTERIMDTIAFQVGMVGPHSYAEQTQAKVHEWINNEKPAGWDYQLEDEVGVNVVYERKWRLYARAIGDSFGVDFIPHVGGSLGNVQTYANTGGTVRLGFNVPSDFGVNLIRGGGSTNTPIDDRDPRVSPDRSTSIFLFGGADGRAVARDIFLDGNTFESSRDVDKKPLVADLYYGIGVILGRWQLTYTEVMRTKEFDGQRHNNFFGSVTLSRAF